jgi:hypothetical protein
MSAFTKYHIHQILLKFVDHRWFNIVGTSGACFSLHVTHLFSTICTIFLFVATKSKFCLTSHVQLVTG